MGNLEPSLGIISVSQKVRVVRFTLNQAWLMTQNHLKCDLLSWKMRVLNLESHELSQALLQTKLSLLNELHQCHARKTFRKRSHSEHGWTVYCLSVLVLIAKITIKDHLVIFGHLNLNSLELSFLPEVAYSSQKIVRGWTVNYSLQTEKS